MKKYVILTCLVFGYALAANACLALPVHASGITGQNPAHDPQGIWRVKDKSATIKIMACKKSYWGIIDWEKEPGIDTYNPDKSKQILPMKGLPILRNMLPVADNKWQGTIYNADNGKTYNGNIMLESADRLTITGCLLDGFLCGKEDWQRAKSRQTQAFSQAEKDQWCAALKMRL